MAFKKRQDPPEEAGKPAPAPETTLLGKVTYPGQTAAANVAAVPEPPREAEPQFLRGSLFAQVDKNPQNATAWILLGWSSADARYAAAYFQKALEAEPENPVAKDGLEWARSEMGEAAFEQVEFVSAAPAVPVAPAAEFEAALALEPAAAPAMAVPESAAVPAGIAPRRRDFRWRTISRFYQIPFFRNLSIALAYLLLICAAEFITVLVNPTAGVIAHASIMVALLVQGSVIQQGPFRRYLIILALAPLIRLLSMSLPMLTFSYPVMYRYMIVGIPILLAAFFAARSVGLSVNRLYFTWKGWPLQILFSLCGLALGTCEYYILHPTLLVPSAGWFDIGMGVFILIVFTGFLEEFIFRSLLQVSGIQLFGTSAIWMISILFGVLHIGYYSAFDVFFAGSVGLMFGYFALRTRSLLGISLAHGLTNITLYIILPLVLH